MARTNVGTAAKTSVRRIKTTEKTLKALTLRKKGFNYTKIGEELGCASHPSRVRGLKYWDYGDYYMPRDVAPFTGAWIEIPKHGAIGSRSVVAPFTGAWIEITMRSCTAPTSISRTLHGCVD